MTEGAEGEEMDFAVDESVQKAFEQHQMSECVQVEIDRLPESLRTVLLMADRMEFSHREIAEILGITVENVKVRLHQGPKKAQGASQTTSARSKPMREMFLVCQPKANPTGE